jgi:hypothetical protein
MLYTKSELREMETIEQAWDGDELKVECNDFKVWLVNPENRQWNGDYVVEVNKNGKWEQTSYYFENF